MYKKIYEDMLCQGWESNSSPFSNELSRSKMGLFRPSWASSLNLPVLIAFYIILHIFIHICMYIYIYIQRGYAPFRRAWAVGFGTWEGAFWSHVGVFWGPSWGLWRSKLEVLEPFWGLCWVL